jgi:hypothetical protein
MFLSVGLLGERGSDDEQSPYNPFRHRHGMIYEDRERCTLYPWLARSRDAFVIVARMAKSASLHYREQRNTIRILGSDFASLDSKH